MFWRSCYILKILGYIVNIADAIVYSRFLVHIEYRDFDNILI